MRHKTLSSEFPNEILVSLNKKLDRALTNLNNPLFGIKILQNITDMVSLK